MLKIIFYMSLTAIGLAWSLSSPLIGAIACIEAYFLNPITIAKDAPISRYQLYTAVCFIVGLVASGPRQLPSVGKEGVIVKALWAYTILCLASTLWAHADAMEAYKASVNFTKTVLIAWLFLFVIRSERELRAIVIAILVGGLHAAFMHTEGIDLKWVSKKWGDEWGVMPDMQGSVMVTLLPLFVLTAMYGQRWWEKALGWVGMPLVVNSVVETYQRSYFVGLAVETMLFLLFLPKRVALRLTPVIGAGGLLFLFVLTPENYWDWMNTIADPTEEASANSRFVIYKASFDCLAENPLGVGYRNYHNVSHKYLPPAYISGKHGGKSEHSTLAAVYTQTGWPGFFTWGTCVGGGLLLLRKVRKSSDPRNLRPLEIYAMAFEIGLYGWLAGGLFHSDHEGDPAYWMLIMSVIIYRLRFGQQYQHAPQPVYYDPRMHPPLSPYNK